ncbi:MAG: Gfo/Idh/MocA family oxidoreductase [Bacteroidales bacterium]|nr:Gfo/Idh/MocA family oxidoreductase [Bacteroidales bacterium]MBR7026493.1 Gfo/Idh/MocA family oxidoreductase [Bacteroidales bacterium]
MDKLLTRKEFLSNLGSMFAVGSAISLFPWLTSCTEKGQKEIEGQAAKLGIIGTGSRGQFHIANLLVDKSARIVALCDDYEPHLQAAAAMCPDAKLYSDYHKLLDDKDVDGVIICTPLNLHAPMTIDSFRAGKHVFCEKSMAYSIQDCKDVIAEWQRSGKVFVVGQQRLFDPKYIKAMELIHSGAIGEVVGIRNYWYRNNDWRREVPSPELERRINWRLYNESSRGLMTELACHQLQNGSWAMDQYPECVTGMGSIRFWKDGREVFDNVAVTYEYPNGVHMTFESIISNKHFGMGEFILGSEGTIDLVKGIMFSEQPAYRSGIEQFLMQIKQGILSNNAFAGSSWSQEDASTDPGIRFTDKIITTDGSSSTGATNDGSVELAHAFCHAVITGQQPDKIVKEAYYATALALLGDQASHEKSTLYLEESDRIL